MKSALLVLSPAKLRVPSDMPYAVSPDQTADFNAQQAIFPGRRLFYKYLVVKNAIKPNMMQTMVSLVETGV